MFSTRLPRRTLSLEMRLWYWSDFSGGRVSFLRRSERRRMEVMGVRSSCETLATKSDWRAESCCCLRKVR